MKKIISLLLSIVLLFQVGAEAFAAYTEDRAKAYEYGNCTITYTIENEWDNYQQISMSVTNNGSETLRNWALKFDSPGEITNIWNAEVCKNDGEIIALRNSGYNYEIVPDGTVDFGFQLRGEDIKLPESISLCNKIVDSTADAEIDYEIRDKWDDGFIAEVSVTNNSDMPLEAWQLSFNGNFEITNFWNANKLYSENGFLFENNVSTMPIAKGETKTFGFQGTITSGKIPGLSDFVLTSIMIDLESEQPIDPDKPIDPDNPIKLKEHSILCFGKYNEENKSIELFWKSTDDGTVTICESTDGLDWNNIAEVSDDNSYIYNITEDYFEKQFKVKQETINGTIESDPFIASYTKNGFAVTWPDNDGDGIPDYLEKIYGTNPDSSDTDCDGLTDYEEILKVGTDPLKYDTDENGVNDGEDDLDKDGLSNKEELKYETSVSSVDTDKDGLSDYDEVYVYGTDPLKADSDGDGLNDGDEIAIGLDPNDPKTFGVPDAEYKIEQTISSDSEVLENINTEESPYEVSLEISASGNALSQLIANQSAFSAVTKSNARLGGAADFSYLNGEVNKVKLTYKIDEKYISDEAGEYSEKCLDLQGIKRYNIFRYFEELDMLLPVATEFDEENNTLSAETDELGTYCVLDMEVLMQNLGIEPEDGITTETVERIAYSAAAYSEEDNTEEVADGDYNIIFIIDSRSTVISEEQFNAIREQILEFAETVVAEKRDLKITVYNQSASDFTKSCCELGGSFEPKDHDYESTGRLSGFIGRLSSPHSDIVELFGENCIISDGLEEAISICRSDTKNYIFDIYAQENAIYDPQCSNSIQSAALENKVNISIISDTDLLTGFQSKLADSTNGIVLNYNEDFAGKVYEHIFNEEYVQKKIPEYKYGTEFDAVLATGLQKVFLNSELYPNGKNPSGEDTDTDMDGLSDWDEVNFAHWEELGLITYDEKHNVILPTIGQCAEFTKKSYVSEGLKRLEGSSDYAVKLLDTRVMPISSDPTNGDGLLDSFERRKHLDPLNADFDGDGLSDGEEYNKYGTYYNNKDSDGDGLDDKYEVENGLNPLSWDTDGDGLWDAEDENPTHFDIDWESIALDLFLFEAEFYFDYLDGVIRGDFIREPNLAQLIGMIAGSFIPGIDIRDVIANLVNGDLGGAALSAVGLIPAAGDIAKLVGKVSDFIITGVKNADEIGLLFKFAKKIAPQLIDGLKQADNFSDVLRHVPCKEAKELFLNEPAIKKMLELPSNSGKYADEIVDTVKKISAEDVFDLFETFADNNYYDAVVEYEKQYQQLLSKTSDLQEEVQAAIKYAEKPVALDILVETSKFGENVPAVINKWGAKDFYTLSHHIAESGIPDEIVIEIYDVWLEFGDVLPSALIKGGIKNTKHIIELRSKLASNQMLRVLELTQDYGSNVITAIIKCGVENIDLIINGITLCDKRETAARLLRALANHGDAILKVISKYPNLSTQTIEDYLTISETFGSYADEIINKNTVKEFIGLDDALKHTDKQAICFSSSENGLCVVTVNGTRSYNDTIREVPGDVMQRILKSNGDIAECSKAYDSLLRREHLSYIEQHYSKAIRDEYEKLVIAIEDARVAAGHRSDAIKYSASKIEDDFTFCKGRSIINCAEIWSAREMILHGAKFEDIKIGTHYFVHGDNFGSLFYPCENCEHVFKSIKNNVDGYGLR